MPTQHVIEQGESVVQLAERYGLSAETVWNDAANANLKEKRGDMNVLMPGDVLVITDKTPKSVGAVTGKQHRFRRKGVPAYFRLQLFHVYEPRVKEKYTLVIDDGSIIEGTTNDQGVIELFVPTSAKEGTLIVGPEELELHLRFGHLDPHDEVAGIQKRLNNLGFRGGEPNGVLDEGTRAALAELQSLWGITASGEPDTATLRRIATLHDQVGAAPRPTPSEPD
jgi:N-acetylmuramoyl-L-alanine amidase